LPPVDRAILAYVEKLTRAPQTMIEADVAALRAAGLSDAAIFHVCQVASYFNFINRIADGLGVALEPEYQAEAQAIAAALET